LFLDDEPALASPGRVALVLNVVPDRTLVVRHGGRNSLRLASHQDLDLFVVSLWQIHGVHRRIDATRRQPVLFPQLQLSPQYHLGGDRGMDPGPASLTDGVSLHGEHCGDTLWHPMLQIDALVLLSLCIDFSAEEVEQIVVTSGVTSGPATNYLPVVY